MTLCFRMIMLCIAGILFTGRPIFSQSARLSVAKEPSWIVKNDINYNKTSLDKEAAEGSLDIYFEAQISLLEHCKYIRQCKKLISQAGVQNESTISVSFDPSYQHVVFHSIQIVRKGQILNRLQLSKIKTVHQEDDLDNFIYNGTIDAVLILDDTRPGDIIEYSYSVNGFNPVFKDKYTGAFNTGFSVPVYDLFYRVLIPKGRLLNVKNSNETIQPVVKEINGQQAYEWRKSDLAPLIMQDNTPSWYNPYPRIAISEYKTWKEVNDWAIELFPAGKNLSAAAQRKIAEFTAGYPDDAGRTMAALRFVQDDIRYMGIEMGRYSHKPADPSKIFAQRFGDCKEKSYLLCRMLNAMNIEASPVLINTTVKKELQNVLPAPTEFNHCTVRVKIDSVYYWFDPTIAYQRGNIKETFYPDYQAGLVINENTTALTTIPFRNISYQHINDYFKVNSMTGSGSLVVTTSYKGDEADGMRSNFNNQSIAEIQNNNKKFYGKFYEDIKADSLAYADSDSTGIFTTMEYYTLPGFWAAEKSGLKKFLFSPFAINGILNMPKEKDRKMPIGLMFPASYREDITISLPEDWNITAGENHLKNKGFTYNSKFSCSDNQVHLTVNYENHKDFIAPDETAEYYNSIKEYDKNEYYSLSYGTENEKNKNTTASGVTIFSVIALIAAIASLAWWSRRR